MKLKRRQLTRHCHLKPTDVKPLLRIWAADKLNAVSFRFGTVLSHGTFNKSANLSIIKLSLPIHGIKCFPRSINNARSSSRNNLHWYPKTYKSLKSSFLFADSANVRAIKARFLKTFVMLLLLTVLQKRKINKSQHGACKAKNSAQPRNKTYHKFLKISKFL